MKTKEICLATLFLLGLGAPLVAQSLNIGNTLYTVTMDAKDGSFRVRSTMAGQSFPGGEVDAFPLKVEQKLPRR